MENKEKSFIQEFKDFVVKGNIVEVAVGFIIGAGFTNLIQSFVTNIIMPPIGQLLGNASFSELYWNLSDKSYPSLQKAEEAGAAVIKYGLFISEVVDFLILALVVFIVLRYILKYKIDDKRS